MILIFHGRLATRESRLGGKNPPLPPFNKGGFEGFESYFPPNITYFASLCKRLKFFRGEFDDAPKRNSQFPASSPSPHPLPSRERKKG